MYQYTDFDKAFVQLRADQYRDQLTRNQAGQLGDDEVIRLDETRGRIAAQKRMAANLVIVLAVALPAAVGFALALPAFDRLLVPPSFQGAFSAFMAPLLPGFVALAIFQGGNATRLTKIDIAGQLTHDHDIQPGNHFRLQR